MLRGFSGREQEAFLTLPAAIWQFLGSLNEQSAGGRKTHPNDLPSFRWSSGLLHATNIGFISCED
jgi:hypothetical protein